MLVQLRRLSLLIALDARGYIFGLTYMRGFNKNNDRVIKNTSLGIKLKIYIIGNANENEKK